MTKKQARALVGAAIDSKTKMAASAMALVLFTDHYERDPVALMQFALAILLDKPLYLLAPRGRLIPANVRAVAAGIEFYEPGDEKAAAQRLLAKAIGGS
jgi:hypothetical protein